MFELEVLSAEIDQNLTAALLALGKKFNNIDMSGRAEVITIVRQLTAIQGQLARPVPSKAVRDTGGRAAERDEDRIARQDEASADRIDVMLSGLCLSTVDRRFSQELGEQIVELVSDTYAQAMARHEGYDPACITAAVTVALMTVCDPDPADDAA